MGKEAREIRQGEKEGEREKKVNEDEEKEKGEK